VVAGASVPQSRAGIEVTNNFMGLFMYLWVRRNHFMEVKENFEF